jgi:hypothetical protein
MSYQKNWNDDLPYILRLSTDYILLSFAQNRYSKAITSSLLISGSIVAADDEYSDGVHGQGLLTVLGGVGISVPVRGGHLRRRRQN